jgi:hemoglobin
MINRLYEKIGGGKTISALVRVFYDKVQADPRLGRFFRCTDMDNLRARQAMFLTMLLGGTRSFTRIALDAAHAGARAEGMTDSDFDTLLSLFAESLQEVNVEQNYVDEVLRLLETTRESVLGRK